MEKRELSLIERHKANERLMAAIFGKKHLDPRLPLCYPYIIKREKVEERTAEGEIQERLEEKTLYLDEVIQEVLEDLLRSTTTPKYHAPWEKAPKDKHPKVLKYRFGLEDGEPKTLKKIAQELTVTRERVRQIEAKALRMLRHPSRSRKLKDFFVPSPEKMAKEKAEQIKGHLLK